MANVIEKLQRPTLVIAHNKTLAAQLYNEFKEFFPENHVEYFVSYYDYYQPESYIPAKDQYIEKDSHINPKIEQMRLAATASLLSRSDVIVVASVSCIYGLGNPENFQKMGFEVKVGERISRREILGRLVDILFERNDLDLSPGRFRSKGDTIDLVPGYFNNIIRIELFGDEVERISEVDRQTGQIKEDMNYFFIYPARHYVIPEEEQKAAIETIMAELEEQLPQLGMIEAHRLRQRTLHDMEMISETGSCKGIENYSRHFDSRSPGEAPYCLIDYFPDDFLLVIDESHQTLPQLRAMYKGDRSRKKSLVDYGFRLPSAFDNRPLRFEEFEQHMKNVIFVSATPGAYELEQCPKPVEQIIRPTGLLDPLVEIRPIEGQVRDVMTEIHRVVEKGDRALVTTLTKRLAEPGRGARPGPRPSPPAWSSARPGGCPGRCAPRRRTARTGASARDPQPARARSASGRTPQARSTSRDAGAEPGWPARPSGPRATARPRPRCRAAPRGGRTAPAGSGVATPS